MAFRYLMLGAHLMALALGALWHRAIDQGTRSQAAKFIVLRAGTSAWTLRTLWTADSETPPLAAPWAVSGTGVLSVRCVQPRQGEARAKDAPTTSGPERFGVFACIAV
jgi:hypothetical protein